MRIAREFIHTVDIERSTFITNIIKISSEEEAKQYIASIKKQHPDANHHCSAYVLGHNHEIQRCSDDGEPSGTAGVPMLTSLRNNHLIDTCVVVTRYFGGIKLGTGGLIRAYSNCVTQAIHHAPKLELLNVELYTLEFSYDYINQLDHYLPQYCTITDKQYDVSITYHFYSQDSDIIERITNMTKGKFIPRSIGTQLLEKEISS